MTSMIFTSQQVISVNMLYDFSCRPAQLCRLIKLSVEELQENRILGKVFKFSEKDGGWHKTVSLTVGVTSMM